MTNHLTIHSNKCIRYYLQMVSWFIMGMCMKLVFQLNICTPGKISSEFGFRFAIAKFCPNGSGILVHFVLTTEYMVLESCGSGDPNAAMVSLFYPPPPLFFLCEFIFVLAGICPATASSSWWCRWNNQGKVSSSSLSHLWSAWFTG